MYPKLFEIFGLPVYSFGLMMGISFIVGSMLLTNEMNRKKINVESSGPVISLLRALYISVLVFFFLAGFIQSSSIESFTSAVFNSAFRMLGAAVFVGMGILLFRKPTEGMFDLAGGVTIICLLFGVVGSKVLYLFENWQTFAIDPLREAFSPGGLTWYGGFLLVTTVIFWLASKIKISFWKIADAVSPALLFAYGIARIGCHLSGDGDYGFPTTLPWGTDYSNGTYPPSLAFKGFPEITSQYPHGIVPDNTLCQPTPVYEFIICTVLFCILWRNRTKIAGTGRMFMWYLVAAGAERFTVEFLRINPRMLLGLSEAQLIAAVLVLFGVYGLTAIPTDGKKSIP